jgi:hypothetical protein
MLADVIGQINKLCKLGKQSQSEKRLLMVFDNAEQLIQN